jgi:putative addiction module antidote
MTQKVIQIGSSAGVTLSKETLKKLGLKVGDRVQVEVDDKSRLVAVRPEKKNEDHDDQIARLTRDFIERYRDDLEALAKK